MELNELKSIWEEHDKILVDNTRINKEILRRMLISKPEKRINWIKINAGFNILSPILFIALILSLDIQFYISPNFYLGLILFLPVLIITYVWDVKYFILLRNVDSSLSVVSIKKSIAILEKYKIKTTRIKYLLMPIAMTGCILMIVRKFTFSFDLKSAIPLLLIVIVFIFSFYFTIKFSIFERYKKLNKEIEDMSMLEKEF